MNSLKFRLLLIVFFISFSGLGQNCKNSKKGIRQAKKFFDNEKIVKATKSRYLFSKFSQAVTTYLVESETEYYLAIIFIREFGRRIDLLDENPLTLQLANNEIITLYAKKSSLGKFTIPVTTERNKQFYTITKEQLQLLSDQPVHHVKIYFSSDKVPEGKMNEDDLGTFFDYEILNKRYQTNLIDPSKCILKE